MHAQELRPENAGRGRTPSAFLRLLTRPGGATTVILVLHGGRARSVEPMKPWRLAYLRMWWLALRIRRTVRAEPAVGVWLLRNRVRGWNEPARDPLMDARWALAEIRARHPGANVVLIGHSMGGRAALLLAAEPEVNGVCALAPWTEASDPCEHLDHTVVLLAHGDRDRTTSATATKNYAHNAFRAGQDARFRIVPGGGHAMLRHHRRWDELVRAFVRGVVGDERESRRETGLSGNPSCEGEADPSPE